MQREKRCKSHADRWAKEARQRGPNLYRRVRRTERKTGDRPRQDVKRRCAGCHRPIV